VIHVAWIVAPCVHILTTQKVRATEQGLVRDAQQHPVITYAADLGQGSLGLLDMLKHLKANNQIELAILKWQRKQIADTEIIAGADMPGNLQRLNLLIHPDRVRMAGENIAHAKALTTTSVKHAPHR
jgi:hypothetical protein